MHRLAVGHSTGETFFLSRLYRAIMDIVIPLVHVGLAHQNFNSSVTMFSSNGLHALTCEILLRPIFLRLKKIRNSTTSTINFIQNMTQCELCTFNHTKQIETIRPKEDRISIRSDYFNCLALCLTLYFILVDREPEEASTLNAPILLCKPSQLSSSSAHLKSNI